MKIKDTIKIPLTICNIGRISFSETLEILSSILDEMSLDLSVKKYSYSCLKRFFCASSERSRNIAALNFLDNFSKIV